MSPARDPSEDPSFDAWVRQWGDGTLGLEEDEGLGLLWKEGLFSELLSSLHRRAPRTMAAFAQRLAEGAPPLKEDSGYIPRRILDAWLAAMALPQRERTARLDALELLETKRELRSALEELDPPMPSRFRHRLEAWLDAAEGIEGRAREGASARPPTFEVGSRVEHLQFGAGVVTAVRPGDNPLVTVQLAGGDTKKVLARFLQPRDEED